MSVVSSAGQMQNLGQNLNSVIILHVRFSQKQDLLSSFFIRQKKGHTLSPFQEKCVPTCQRTLLKSLPLLCGIPNHVKETKKRKKQVNILLLLGMFFLLVCTGSIFGIIQQFLAKWKILEQSMFVITF